MGKEEKDRLACTYAALLLHDGDLEISEEKLSKVLKASNNQVESYWPSLFAKAMKGQDVAKLLSAVGTAAPAATGPAAGAGAAAPAEKKSPRRPMSTWETFSEVATTTTEQPVQLIIQSKAKANEPSIADMG